MTPREFGVLFSHAADHWVYGGFHHWTQAELYGGEVADAQPGVEYAVVGRIGDGPWQDVGTGETPSQITASRWAS